MVEEEPVDDVAAAGARGQEEEIAFFGLALVGQEGGFFGQGGSDRGDVVGPASFQEAGDLVFVEGVEQHGCVGWGGGGRSGRGVRWGGGDVEESLTEALPPAAFKRHAYTATKGLTSL